ncbi:hypothetical protein [Melaminivora alkalimesophila]|uniref:Uncharacterized protein n=1 Tax=Melaminivora alkalimesophila TaxID=1165852 RepID=A0A317RHS9_9BURK|nr:hypothetical protein [Melaminivora alkalimesophila]PWW48646.1 hypothetical protein DFR36_101150 [Melaminivora alkalimesophila]
MTKTQPDDPHLAHAAAWSALGVQHAILARAMPVVRHDLAGMLTIMRMGTVVLRRRVAAEASSGAGPSAAAGESIATQLDQLEEHLASLSDSARRLRHWDLGGPAKPEPLAATAELAHALAYPLLAMRGLELALGSPEQSLPSAPAPQQPMLCLLLGAIHILAEDPDPIPACVRVVAAPEGPGLRVQAEGQAADAPPATPAPGMPVLDAAALERLARHLGVGLRHGPGWFEIEAPAAAPAPAAVPPLP